MRLQWILFQERQLIRSRRRRCRKAPEVATIGPPLPNDKRKTDPDLASPVAAWPLLPEAIRADILAMVKTSNG